MFSFEELFGCVRVLPEAKLFCDNPKCECHENQFVISIIATYVAEGLLTPDEANRIFRGGQL